MKFVVVGAFGLVCATCLLGQPRQSLAPLETFDLGPAAAADGMTIGSAVHVSSLTAPDFASLASTLPLITPESSLKWAAIAPESETRDYAQSDVVVEFAREAGVAVRGHTLVWSEYVPDWVDDIDDPDVLGATIESHVSEVIGRYRGTIREWDVVNEATTPDGNLTESHLLRVLGTEYIDIAFKAARASDITADLYLNELMVDVRQRRAVLALVAELLDRGVPVDGVGFQLHLLLDEGEGAMASLGADLAEFDELGLKVAFTEVDIAIPSEHPTSDQLRRQAELYRTLYRICRDAPNCDTLVVWGLDDARSWIPEAFPGWSGATLLDVERRPKPAYLALRSEAISAGAK